MHLFAFAFVCKYCSRPIACAYVRAYAHTYVRARRELHLKSIKHHLSRSIDEASYINLISRAPDICSKALALSTAIPHAGDWLNVIPFRAIGFHLHDWEFRLCLHYWLGLQWFSAQFASRWLILWVIIRWVVVVMGIVFIGTIPSETHYFLQPKPLLWNQQPPC